MSRYLSEFDDIPLLTLIKLLDVANETDAIDAELYEYYGTDE